MSSTRTRIAASLAAAAGIAALAAAPASAAPADGRCQAAGIATLRSLASGLDTNLSFFVDNGVPVSAALANGVTVRPGKAEEAAPLIEAGTLPFQTVLADHRAGSDSIFVYPWCG